MNPSIRISEPPNRLFATGNVKVVVLVANFTVVNKLGQPNVPGEGHIHYFLDVDPPTTPGAPAFTTPGTYGDTADTTYTWTNVSSGYHKFSAELVNNDHTPLVPPVVYALETNIIPEIGPPNIVIVSPRDGAAIAGSGIAVSVQVTNFNLVDKIGLPSVAREGHIHYFLDVTAPTDAGKPAVTAAGTYAAATATTYNWANVTTGSHTLSVELVNNDHTPLSPPVVAKVTVNVTSVPPTPTTPGIKITSPTSGSTVSPDRVTITVEVANFNLVNKLGQANAQGEGHIHYFKDVTAPTGPFQPAVTDAGTYAATAATSYTWTNLTRGTHTFSVELVNNDHTPLIPPIVATIMVNVVEVIPTVPPSITITSPADSSTVPPGSITVSVQVSNFNLLDKLGQANVAREGHIHYFLDVAAPTTSGQPAVTAPGTYAATTALSYSWPSVPAGIHTFSVELVNNDHTPLNPPVVAKVTVTVGVAPQNVTVNLTAKGFAFDNSTITVPAGANVTIIFNNQDIGIAHNFALYSNAQATTSFFRGQAVAGPATVTYNFVAPATAGTYFFRCDVHPTAMTGSFVIS